jgi:dihydrofolate reductase
LEAALKFAEFQHPNKEVWIIGGGQVYREAIEKDIPDRLYISEMRGHWEDESPVIDVSSTAALIRDARKPTVVTFPRVNWEYYKALYIDKCEDHNLKILSKTSLDVL